jgi:hypothetical protein
MSFRGAAVGCISLIEADMLHFRPKRDLADDAGKISDAASPDIATFRAISPGEEPSVPINGWLRNWFYR